MYLTFDLRAVYELPSEYLHTLFVCMPRVVLVWVGGLQSFLVSFGKELVSSFDELLRRQFAHTLILNLTSVHHHRCVL